LEKDTCGKVVGFSPSPCFSILCVSLSKFLREDQERENKIILRVREYQERENTKW